MSDAREHLKAVYRLAQTLLGRFLHRYWYRAAQGAGGLGDLFVTVEEVQAELEVGQLAPPIPLDPEQVVDARLDVLRRADAERRTLAPHLPAARLAAGAGLDDDALEMLLVLATLQASPGLLRTCTFAWADFSIKQPTAGFLVELLADDADHRLRLEAALAPDAPLRRLRLLQLGEDRRWQPATPLLQRPVFVPDAVWRFLSERPVFGENYAPGAVQLETAGPLPEDLVLYDGMRVGLLLAGLADGTDPQPVMLVGQGGSGRRTLARAFALAAGRGVLRLELAMFPWEIEPFEDQLAAALRDALLTGAIALLRCECFTDRGDRRPIVLARVLRSMGASVVLTANEDNVPHLAPLLNDVRVANMEEGPTEVRKQLYGRLFANNAFDVEETRLVQLVDMYKLRPGDLDRALRDVRVAIGETPVLDATEFDRAVRRQIRTNLSSLASPMRTTHRWDDLILNEEQREVLDEILAHAKHRQLVFEEWGFGRKIGGRGKGLSCLFSGPPGTGKTMSATLIAGELGLDLYQVDLSRIVDKYVGETEKNLARLFDEASRVPVVLLFDEADSLFATRTKVESSNDRYANLEVNFLLQKMEQHDGICVLTTNLGTGIDEAFKRRLRFRLHFDMPGPEQREQLWRQMVPPGVRVADDVQWDKLARRWEMSGAIIKNAVLRSAFLAAARNEPLTMELLTRAARAELMEMGRLG